MASDQLEWIFHWSRTETTLASRSHSQAEQQQTRGEPLSVCHFCLEAETELTFRGSLPAVVSAMSSFPAIAGNWDREHFLKTQNNTARISLSFWLVCQYCLVLPDDQGPHTSKSLRPEADLLADWRCNKRHIWPQLVLFDLQAEIHLRREIVECFLAILLLCPLSVLCKYFQYFRKIHSRQCKITYLWQSCLMLKSYYFRPQWSMKTLSW